MKPLLTVVVVCSIAFLSGKGAFARTHTFHFDPLADPCGGVICTSDQFCDIKESTNPVCRSKRPLGETCTAEGQCKPGNSECLGDPLECRCVPAFVRFEDSCFPSCTDEAGCQADSFCHDTVQGCLPKVNLNNQCDATGGPSQCSTENAECLADTDSAKCTCGSEFVEKNGACIKKCDDSSCSAYEFCETASGLCKQKKFLGQDCTDTKECLSDNSACITDKCACESDDFVESFGSCLADCVKNPSACNAATQYCSATNNICTPKANLHEGCSDATGASGSCKAENAVCQPGGNGGSTCECDSGFNEEGSMCLAVCTSDVDCAGESKFCNLDNGRCETTRQLGDQCSDNIKCSVDLQCPASGICSCQDGFAEGIVDGDRTCIAKCTRNSDCTGEGLFCSTTSGLCSPQLGLNGLCNIADVNVDTNPCKTPSASCQQDQSDDTLAYCRCDSEFVQDGSSCLAKCKSNADCDPDMKFCHTPSGACKSKLSLGGTCHPTEEATGQCLIEHSDCVANETALTCQCTEGFKIRNGICEMVCTTSEQCSANQYCDSGSSQFCMNKVGLTQPCSYPDQCSVSESECSGEENNQRCRCKENYVDIVGSCMPDCRKIADTCSDYQYCNEDNGHCRNKVALNSPCTKDYECKDSETTTMCSPISKSCTCKSDDYYEESSMCILKCTKTEGCNFELQFCNSVTFKCNLKSNLNGACTVAGEEECTALSTCEVVSDTLKQCKCVDLAIASIDNKRCLRLATAIGGSCEEPQQCSVPALVGNEGATNTTQCSTNLQCDCAASAIKAEGKCYLDKSIGYSCKEDVECSVPITDGMCNLESQECGCKSDATGSNSGKKCLKLATAIGDSCEEPQQCNVLPLIGNEGATNTTQCSTNLQCDCAASAIKAEGKCYLDKSLGYSCKEDVECSVSITDGLCNPESQECGCKSDATGSNSGKKCLKLATALGDSCEEPQQCNVPALIGNNGVTNTTQCASDKCECATSAVKSDDGKCYLNKGLGDVCQTDMECTVSITGGKCDTATNKCVCTAGTQGSVGSKQCSKPSGAPVNANFHPVWILLALITSFCFLP